MRIALFIVLGSLLVGCEQKAIDDLDKRIEMLKLSVAELRDDNRRLEAFICTIETVDCIDADDLIAADVDSLEGSTTYREPNSTVPR